jgi:hypothetical protein
MLPSLLRPLQRVRKGVSREWREDKECMGFFHPNEKFSPGFEPVNANLSKASALECLLSRRDSTIVARHEVPGMMRKIAPSQRDD